MAILTLDIYQNRKIGQILSVLSLSALNRFFKFGKEMLLMIDQAAQMNYQWKDFLKLCMMIIHRNREKINVIQANISSKEKSEEIVKMIKSIFGNDILVKINIDDKLGGGFMIHILSLDILCDYSYKALERKIDNKINTILGGVNE